jgi:hypothetical protein
MCCKSTLEFLTLNFGEDRRLLGDNAVKDLLCERYPFRSAQAIDA